MVLAFVRYMMGALTKLFITDKAKDTISSKCTANVYEFCGRQNNP